MGFLSGKHVLLGVTGGIAAYKAAELVRRLREQGAEVRVIMTAGACEFITPLTLQALSGNPVHTQLLDADAEAAMGHIELARWADVLLVAPATADFIARVVHGRADDLLAAGWLACEAPQALAPAMNRAMWRSPATQDNIRVLESRGVHLFGPATGSQACGETGPGRMLEPAELVESVSGIFSTGKLAGLKVLLSAGPTREPLDPVRFISNRSSGRMGFAIAAAAAEAGADVTLVSGPVGLETPAGVTRVDVETAAEMHAAVMARAAEADIFFSVAAVADYRPADVAARKIKKQAKTMMLPLQRNPDILAYVAALPRAPFCVGFAAETDDLEKNARSKLQAKAVDMIAANSVGPGLGFDSEYNALQVFWADGDRSLPLATKAGLARELVGLVAERYRDRNKSNRIVSIHAKDSA